MIHHSSRDNNFHILKHQIENYKITTGGIHSNTKTIKLSEDLCIKNLRPSLNKHEKYISLKHFN